MKYFVNSLAWAALIAFVVACQPKTPDPDQNLQILSLYFREIPAEDVAIDQEKKLITVRAPEYLPSGEIIPYVELSGQAELKPVNWRGLFYGDCPECRKLELFDKNAASNIPASSGTPQSTYTVTLLPAGPLTIDATALAADFDPRDYQLKPTEYGPNFFFLPFRNLHGNDLPTQAKFTNLDNKEVFIVKDSDSPNGPSSSFFFQGASARINQLGIEIQSMEEKLTPGRYQVELTMKNGEGLTTPEFVTLKPGRLRVNNWQPDYEGSRVRPGGTFLLTGGNLSADNLKVELADSLGQVTKLTVADASKYGETARIKLPASLEYEHYVLRISDATARFEFCHQVHNRPGTLAANEIYYMGDYLSSCSIQEPLFFPRDQENYVSVNSVAPRTRLKLVGFQDSTKTYFAESELRHVTQVGESAFVRFPVDIPAGRYRVSLQVLDEAGKVNQEGPPYWRVIELK
ncbi:hypothetical protein [Salmonirosea aquatica]|uniref:DUF5007 domain-containing protein n=1 Tax=Salmonirosea aquatica TaxID=2654236 RepID=A0A7C9BEQ8_9BACT|nr:hypothetical protein [Cytophagaceae bacterium SJW1-29]